MNLLIGSFRKRILQIEIYPSRNKYILKRIYKPLKTIDLKPSVIISNYQGINFLPKCLHHLINQTYKNFEVIFVDAGSTDGSPEYVQKDFPEINVIKCGRIGIGEAVNIGIRHSTGDIIIFDFNTDEYVEVNWLEEIIKQLEKFNFNIITGTTRLIYGTNLIDEAGVNINLFGQAKKIGHLKETDTFIFPNRAVDYVGSPAFHRKILEKIGPIDEDYFIYAEDLDFCYRAKLIGIETKSAPLARSHHHIRGTMSSNKRVLEYFLRRAHIRFQIIYSSPFRILISLTFICIFLTFASLVGAVSCLQNSPIFYDKFIGRIKAILWNIKNINKTLNRRKQIILIKNRPHLFL